jgi:hypothetical protein
MEGYEYPGSVGGQINNEQKVAQYRINLPFRVKCYAFCPGRLGLELICGQEHGSNRQASEYRTFVSMLGEVDIVGDMATMAA